jgi:hypothetical protein
LVLETKALFTVDGVHSSDHSAQLNNAINMLRADRAGCEDAFAGVGWGGEVTSRIGDLCFM